MNIHPNDPVLMWPKSYARVFAGGFNCVLKMTAGFMEVQWTPDIPTGQRWLREYTRWRDRCINDYAQRTGILHVIVWDRPREGMRMRWVKPLTPQAATVVAAAAMGPAQGTA